MYLHVPVSTILRYLGTSGMDAKTCVTMYTPSPALMMDYTVLAEAEGEYAFLTLVHHKTA